MSLNSKQKIIAAGIIGNIVEYYDFALIGFLTIIMGKLFFPSNDTFVSILGSFGAFAAGMIMRPIGAAVFGHIGDRVGRRFALMTSLVLMALPTFMIGLLPTYEQIGIIAPVLLVLLRMIQGLSVGGEYASSIVYLVEQSTTNRQNLYGSFVSIGAKIGMALGSGFCGTLFWYLGDDAMLEWGWRVPFLFSIVIAGTGLYLRKNLTDNYQPHQTRSIPIVEIFKHHKKLFIQFTLVASVIWMFYYTIFIYLPLWLEQSVGFPKDDAGFINIVSIVAGVIFIPLMAMAADRYGSFEVMKSAAIATAAAILPLSYMIVHGGFTEAVIGVAMIVILLCAYQAPIFAAVVNALDHKGHRASFTALILGSAAGFVGGATPALMTLLVKFSGNLYMPAYLIAIFSIAAFAVLRQIEK